MGDTLKTILAYCALALCFMLLIWVSIALFQLPSMLENHVPFK